MPLFTAYVLKPNPRKVFQLIKYSCCLEQRAQILGVITKTVNLYTGVLKHVKLIHNSLWHFYELKSIYNTSMTYLNCMQVGELYSQLFLEFQIIFHKHAKVPSVVCQRSKMFSRKWTKVPIPDVAGLIIKCRFLLWIKRMDSRSTSFLIRGKTDC